MVEENQYYNEVNKILVLILVLNLLVAIVKVVTGSFYNILSIVSDGYDSFFDGISNVAGIISLFFARKPGDNEHRYGHSKVETFASIIIAILLFYVSIEIIHSAIDRFYGVGMPNITLISFVVLVATLLVNIFVTKYEHKKGVELKSDLLITDSKHTKSDVYATIIVLVGMVFIKLGLPILDPILSFLIALLIIKTGLEILYENLNILMDKEVYDDEKIRNIIMEKKEVIDVHNIRTRGTPAEVHLDMHMVVSGKLSLKEAHDISHRCENMIRYEIPEIKDVLIHIEPEDGMNDKINYKEN